jgi:drug/metabolite transporter (DMT)-like permease
MVQSATPDRSTLLAFAGVVLFGGMNAIGVRQSVLELAPLWAAAIRFAAAGLIMAGLVLVTRRRFPRGRGLWGAVVYGLVGFTASFALIYTALREVSGGTGAVLIALTPLLTFGLAIAQRQERFHVQGLLGALVALAGVGIIFADEISAEVPLGSLALVVLGSAFIAEAGILLKWVPRSDPIATNAVAMLVGAAVLGGFSLAAGETRALPTQTGTWLAMGYLVTFGSVIVFSLNLYALKRWTASAVSYATLLFPFIGVTVATLVTGERFSPALLVGGAVMLAGVYVGAFVRRPHRTSATSAPECLPIDACADEAVEAIAAKAKAAA